MKNSYKDSLLCHSLPLLHRMKQLSNKSPVYPGLDRTRGPVPIGTLEEKTLAPSLEKQIEMRQLTDGRNL